MSPLSADKRVGRMRRAFEEYVTRGWHKSWRMHIFPNKHGAYQNFDMQQAWIHFQAGWRRARR